MHPACVQDAWLQEASVLCSCAGRFDQLTDQKYVHELEVDRQLPGNKFNEGQLLCACLEGLA